ncbi:MAG TPA: hypothetical protein VHN99_08955 [Deinococcales bacterium]|nr:hypothetical protein [Deinococcales bacterium]
MRPALAVLGAGLAATALAAGPALPARGSAGWLSDIDASSAQAHLVVAQALQACGGRVHCPGADLNAAAVTRDATRAVENNLDTAWRDFQRQATETIAKKLNAAPPCSPPTPCPGVPNAGCIATRQVQGIAEALAQDLPTYWKAVGQSLLTGLPEGIWWTSPLPGGGAVLALVTDAQGRVSPPGGDARAGAYFPPSGAHAAVPVRPGESGPPGIRFLEDLKTAFPPAGLGDYERYGYASFFEVYGGYRDVTLIPTLLHTCLVPGPVPIPVVLPLPIPTLLPRVPDAERAYESVPEGYGLPRVTGRPLGR